MSDQANTAQGGDQLSSLFEGAVTFEEVPEGQDWNDDSQQVDAGQQTEDSQQVDPQADAQPQAKDAKAQPAPAGMTQEQVLQLFAQQQQWNQQALPMAVAEGVKQALAAMGFQAPAAPAPADPYAGIDPESPDADWQRMQIDNRLMREELASLKNKWAQNEQTWKQQQQAQQQQAQQEQFAGWVNENVSKGADFFFQGWPETPQTQALKQMAATQIDAEWARRGYTQAAFTQAVAAVKPALEAIKQFKPAPQGAGQTRAPGAGQRPGQGQGQTAQPPQRWSNPNEFWEKGPFSQAALMGEWGNQQQ